MSKKGYLILFCIFSVYIIYGTTIPFDFTNSQIALDKFNRLTWIPFHSICTSGLLISDIVQNVLFFIPVGFFCMLRFSNARKNLSITGIVFYGFLLSAAVETIQLFSLTRNTSVTDIATNTIGTAVGAIGALWGIRFKLFERINVHKGKETRLFVLIFTVLLIDKLYPFDLSLNISNMCSKMFSLQNSVSNLFVFGNNDIWNLVVTAVFAYLAIENIRLLRKPVLLSVLFLSLSVPFCLEIAKVIVVSRYPDFHNMMIALLGIVSGSSAYFIFYGKRMCSGILLISGVLISIALKMTQLFRSGADNYPDYATYYSYNVMMNLSVYMGLFILFVTSGFIMNYYLKKRVVSVVATVVIIIAASAVFIVKGDWVGAVICVAAMGIGNWICRRLSL